MAIIRAPLHGLSARDFPRTRHALGIMPGDQPQDVFSSLGFTLWEWLNPEQVAAEYEVTGREPAAPVSFGDVIGAAAEDTRDVVSGAAGEIYEGAEGIAGGAQKMVFGLGVVAALAAVVYFSQKRGRK